MRRLTSIAAVSTLVVLASAACSTTTPEAGARSITVFAASSLTDAFTEIGTDFEAANPGTTVEFNFGSSSDLAGSIADGDALGVADVFASADEVNMDKLVEADANAGDPVVFAGNRAEIAVPVGNPGGLDGLADFADPDLFIGLCDELVPCGAYAREALHNAGVEPSVDSNEATVADLVAKVASGDLDAGIVYVTDVRAAGGEVQGIAIPADVNVLATYPITTVDDSGEPDTAARFVRYVLAPGGQRVLDAAGFLPPQDPETTG